MIATEATSRYAETHRHLADWFDRYGVDDATLATETDMEGKPVVQLRKDAALKIANGCPIYREAKQHPYFYLDGVKVVFVDSIP